MTKSIAAESALKKRRRTMTTLQTETGEDREIPSHVESPDRAIIADEFERNLDGAVNRLIVEEATVFRLHELQGMTQAEIGVVCGISQSLVCRHLKSAKDNLREMLMLIYEQNPW
jgi:RNA polymerase sigma factor (sigma-70 family)